MKPLLLIDTASATCTVGLYHAKRIEQRSAAHERQSAQKVLPLINELLATQQITQRELGGIGVISGPGSFTGMRIGVAIAQGLGFANQLPVVPISSLAVLACSAALQSNISHFLIGLKAREDEVYVGGFEYLADVGVRALIKEQVITPANSAEIITTLEQSELWGYAGDLDAEELRSLTGSAIADTRQLFDVRITMEAFLLLMQQSLASDRSFGAATALPNYVKEQMHYN